MLIEKFRDRLEVLEIERIKVLRDRQAYRLLAGLLFVLGALSGLAAIVGRTLSVAILTLVLLGASVFLWHLRKSLSEAYQLLFRERVTREWFRERYRSAYLAPAPQELTEQLRIAVREAAVRVGAQSPNKTTIEERILLDRDSSSSLVFVLREGSFANPRSRSLIWCKLRTDESGIVAFVLPPLFKTQRKVDLSIFRNGKRIALIEPLATRLESLYLLAVSRIRVGKVRVGYTPRGIFLGCRLNRRLFEAPVEQSVFEESFYTQWEVDAELPLDLDLRNQIDAIL